MKVVGLVGGVASGKSLVAKRLAELGGKILSGDETGHAVLRDPEVIEAIRARWGSEVLDSQGQVDRPSVARHVFGDDKKEDRKFLDQLTHPRIKQKLLAELEAYRAADEKLVVLDAALLLEVGWRDLCDVVLFVDAPHEARLARARSRGWSDAMFAAREQAQWPLEKKRTHASAVIDNSGTAAATLQQVDEIFDLLVSRQCGR